MEREKRKKNEMKQKEIVRMQLNMINPVDIGIEAAELGRESIFNLKSAEKTGILDKLAKGKRRMIFDKEELAEDNDIHIDENAPLEDRDELAEADELESQLDGMYRNYKERKAERDAKFRAKQAREAGEADNWEGFKETPSDEESEDGEKDYVNDDDDSELSDSDDDEAINQLIAKLKSRENGSKLSSKARALFSDSLFEGVEPDLPGSNCGVANSESVGDIKQLTKKRKLNPTEPQEQDSSSSDDDSDFEIIPNNEEKEVDSDYDSEEEERRTNKEKHSKEIDIATVEAMTLAHQLALGHKTKHDLVEEGFNRYSFRDTENLPEWFIEEEKQHSKINKPITKEAAIAIKEKLKALNARPIKKVAEAKARKKHRAVARLEKLKKKAGLINDDSDKSEKDKAEDISKLMKKVTKKAKQRPKVTVVVASGKNRGLSGRPKGIKGKYKMVDGVLKNEQRALKRIAKKHHKKK